MPLEAPHNQSQHHRCSGGRSSSFGHNNNCIVARKDLLQDRRAAMSRRNNGKSPKLELKLNLSLPMASRRVGAEEEEEESSPNRSLALSSPPSSCVSSRSNSPEAISMVLTGCTRCLMYVMLSQEDPKCPKCKNAVLLDFLRRTTTTTTTTDDDNNNSKKTRKN